MRATSNAPAVTGACSQVSDAAGAFGLGLRGWRGTTAHGAVVAETAVASSRVVTQINCRAPPDRGELGLGCRRQPIGRRGRDPMESTVQTALDRITRDPDNDATEDDREVLRSWTLQSWSGNWSIPAIQR